MREIRALQKILATQSEMIILFIPFCSFFMTTTTAKVLKEKVRRKMGRAIQSRPSSGI